MFEAMSTQAARTEHDRLVAEATAHGWMMPARTPWWARLTARLRRAEAIVEAGRGAAVHALPVPPPARPKPAEADQAA